MWSRSANLHIHSTSRLNSCAVQELKIRRPNYSDFSVKTMVIMKLFQQQNGNTCFIIVLKVSFMGKYANYSIKEMKWRIKTILFYFIFPFIKYKHCNIVTILSVRGRLILSSCTAHEGSRLVAVWAPRIMSALVSGAIWVRLLSMCPIHSSWICATHPLNVLFHKQVQTHVPLTYTIRVGIVKIILQMCKKCTNKSKTLIDAI